MRFDAPLGNERFRIVSLHTPPPSVGSYVTEVQRMLDVVALLGKDVPLILGGDFNMTVGVRQPDETLTNRKGEIAVLERLENEFGLLNCWQTANPDLPLAQTLRWMFREDSKPYHCDGLFVPAAWCSRLTSCVVHATEEWHGRSDHYPVVATFAN
jgi:endonuclease/exonuclease/phosphatase family metal-dependent hydrolase